MKRFMVMGAVLVFIATGCATVPRTTQGPCLPPGIAADVFLWPVVETGALGILPVEGGGTARIVYVLYERADRRVADWLGRRPDPDRRPGAERDGPPVVQRRPHRRRSRDPNDALIGLPVEAPDGRSGVIQVRPLTVRAGSSGHGACNVATNRSGGVAR